MVRVNLLFGPLLRCLLRSLGCLTRWTRRTLACETLSRMCTCTRCSLQTPSPCPPRMYVARLKCEHAWFSSPSKLVLRNGWTSRFWAIELSTPLCRGYIVHVQLDIPGAGRHPRVVSACVRVRSRAHRLWARSARLDPQKGTWRAMLAWQ